MDGATETTPTNPSSEVEIDSWAAAFAALDKKNESDSQADPASSDTGANGESGSNDDASQSGSEQTNGSEDTSTMQSAEGTDGNANASGSETGDGVSDQGSAGGLGDPAGESGEQAGESSSDLLGITEEDIQEYRDGLTEDVRDRAISTMAQEFIKRGIRNTNGKLGATIDDDDICKRDSDGVPHFYNPDTGREFTGDNPRRQAQEWCDDYNKELATTFNQACEQYSNQLMEQEAPQIAVLEFASTYDSLDPIRKKMFESIIEDYEIKDDGGDVVGYSVDLNKALGAVNRQVEAIQAYSKANAPASTEEPDNKPSGPALDMKNSSTSATKPEGKPKFNSVAEAMEWQQDQLLAQLNKDNK